MYGGVIRDKIFSKYWEIFGKIWPVYLDPEDSSIRYFDPALVLYIGQVILLCGYH